MMILEIRKHFFRREEQSIVTQQQVDYPELSNEYDRQGDLLRTATCT